MEWVENGVRFRQVHLRVEDTPRFKAMLDAVHRVQEAWQSKLALARSRHAIKI